MLWHDNASASISLYEFGYLLNSTSVSLNLMRLIRNNFSNKNVVGLPIDKFYSFILLEIKNIMRF